MMITYNTNSQIKFKVSLLKSSLCDYSDAYILAKEPLSIVPVPPSEQTQKLMLKK